VTNTPATVIHLSAHDPKRMIVVKPAREVHWWKRWQAERECSKMWGHCYHPEGMVDWFCCMCGHEEDGMPEDECKICRMTTKDES